MKVEDGRVTVCCDAQQSRPATFPLFLLYLTQVDNDERERSEMATRVPEGDSSLSFIRNQSREELFSHL